ncbi:MAG: DUF3800 domain-containing protein [Erysipelotrichaceae bacterium]|nr:DUF3800 domain-containing protein [Erysipelotrichaceae bacterium]
MKYLSVFVDESGDFGTKAKSSSYYVITMVFHDQSFDISDQINRLNHELENLGLCNHIVHSEPLIMRRGEYSNLSPLERKKIFQKIYHFAIKCNIKCKQFYINKNECKDELELKAKLAKEISLFLRNKYEEISLFDKVILYYDNGQKEVNNILNTVFATELSIHETRLAYQKDYRLSQVADMICTLRILEERANSNSLSKSELLVFSSRRELIKDYIKPIKKLEWK